ncbi:hypothetical protein F9802_09310 [Bacillus aerolatus]|uniref:Uncharacterized protein n=1 Tax=Bacillus aerolatus TaxID=2653354 RepID=A0A6I1FG86_9BACI|nr:hypothetical protein [Bacillus aerolatus]KAB7707194.1 hypothetical protein F9802_09310 [Bacillus aerolatus]
MKIREFITNPYILVVLGTWFLASFLTIFYISWTLAAVALTGTVCFYLYISAVYRFVLYKGIPWLEKREDDLFMSLWYAWPVYVLLSVTLFFLAGELWAFAYAAGGAAGIVASELMHLGKEEQTEEEVGKVKVQ